MKGVVARFRHGPKAGEAISEEGLEVLKAQGKEFARWMLSQKADAKSLKKRGVDLSLFFSGVPRAGTSAVEFTKGFSEAMHGANVRTNTNALRQDPSLVGWKNADVVAWKRLLERAKGDESKALKMLQRRPSLVPTAESPAEQGARVELWAAEHTLEVARSNSGPIKVIVGFGHEPVMGSARGTAHPGEKGSRYLVVPGRRAITTPGGLITHVSDEGIATLHEMHHAGNRKHEINYVGHI